MLALVQVPEHSDTVLAAGCRERTIGRDRDGVDVAGVTVVVSLELELGEFPDLGGKLALCRKQRKRDKEGSEILVEKNSLIGRVCPLK